MSVRSLRRRLLLGLAVKLQAVAHWMLRFTGPPDGEAAGASSPELSGEPASAPVSGADASLLQLSDGNTQAGDGPPKHWLEDVLRAARGPLQWIHFKRDSLLPPESPPPAAHRKSAARRPRQEPLMPAKPLRASPAPEPASATASKFPLAGDGESGSATPLEPLGTAQLDVQSVPLLPAQPVRQRERQIEFTPDAGKASVPPSVPAERSTVSGWRRWLPRRSNLVEEEISTSSLSPGTQNVARETELRDEPASMAPGTKGHREIALTRDTAPERAMEEARSAGRKHVNDPWPALNRGREAATPGADASRGPLFPWEADHAEAPRVSSLRASASPDAVSFPTLPRPAPISRPDVLPEPKPAVRNEAAAPRQSGRVTTEAAEHGMRWPNRLEDHWPELPEAAPAESDEWTDLRRIWERRRRLDEEQRGVRWSG